MLYVYTLLHAIYNSVTQILNIFEQEFIAYYDWVKALTIFGFMA